MKDLQRIRYGSIVLTLSFMSAFFFCQSNPKESAMILPENVSGWVRSDTIRTVTSKSIFNYMNGAGELYLGYRFDRLEVVYYQMPGQDEIVAELYFMKSAEDAFGLLSLDWNGDPVLLNGTDEGMISGTVPAARALYGSGLLRVWAGDLFCRIMSYRETPEAREAVLALGRACARSRTPGEVPDWMGSLPPSIPGDWKLERDVHFLRSHLVLNSVYFLSYSNILGLDLSAEIASGRYKIEGRSAHIFAIRYSSEGKAADGMDQFHSAYYPEAPLGSEDTDSGAVVRLTEGTWSGYVRKGRSVVLGFEFPEKSVIEKALKEVIVHIQNQFGGQP